MTTLMALCFALAADPGITVRLYQLETPPDRIPRLIEAQTPNTDTLAPALDLAPGDFALPAPLLTHAIATLVIDRPGPYRFRLTSDDGSRLTLNHALILDHDGNHSATPATSEPVQLEPGEYPLFVEHYDSGGSRSLRLEWLPPDAADFTLLTAPHLQAESDPTRVTSPGVKQVEDGRRPGDGAPLAGVHPAWSLSNIRPPGFEPKVGAMTFLPDGRLVLSTFDPLQRDEIALPDIERKEPDSLYALSNLDQPDPNAVTVTRIAGDLFEPTGLLVVDGVLHVAHRKAVTRLTDRDGDGFLETHQTVGQGWEGWNYHQFAFGLVQRDGLLYTALSTAMAPPNWEGMLHNAGPNGPMRGGLIEIDPQTGDTRVVAAGLRTPNGLGVLPDGTLIYLDNQGTWMPTNQLAELIPGRFYGHYNWTNLVPKLADRFPQGGHPSDLSDRPRTPAAVLFPQNEVSNSPTEPLVITGGLYDGQLLVGELTAGGIRRVFLERVNGQLQGALFRFSQGLESGVNRMAWGPDGSLYVGGIGAGGNWNWKGTQFGLQRLTPNGTTTFEMLAVRATPTGFRVEFTKPVELEWLADPTNWTVRSWTYAPTVEYGGPKVDERDHAVTAVADPSGMAVTLTVEGLEVGRCYHLRTDPVSKDGEPIWSTEAWYTVNALPRSEPVQASAIGAEPVLPQALGVGVPPPAGAVLLTGKADAAAMRYEGKPYPPAAMVQDDFIDAPGWLPVGAGSGDLVSTTVFGDARIHLEWFSPPGGLGQLAANSGVYLQDRYEVQVLGTPAGETRPADNEAGSIYGIKAADENASAGPGQWQAYDLWFRAPRFKGGQKVEDARLTLYWNGRLVHDDVAIPHPTGSRREGGEAAWDGQDIQLGALRLQDHASAAEGPVRFRNVWMMPIGEPAAQAEAGSWVRLFEDLGPEAWMIRGGKARFAMVNGELIGSSVPDSPNTFCTTAERYGDFELVYEVLVDGELNSGVQVRSEVVGGSDNRDGGLTGYQVEIDPSARSFSAGIYDERGRGWLHPLHAAEYARRAFRPGEWNRFRVVARGPVIRTWINGVPAAEVYDAARAEGHIGFQVHDVGKRVEPLTVRFRGAMLRRLDGAE